MKSEKIHPVKNRHFLQQIVILALFAITAISCTTGRNHKIFTEQELTIINDTLTQSGLMKIYIVTDKSDSTLLRNKTTDLSADEIKSDAYKTLCRRMIQTVTDSTVDGVGLAGPQVGISRRVVAVQRFDKEGAPFEVYPNIYIKEYSQETVPGREGCLSVPSECLSDSEKGAPVTRSQWVIISYTHPQTLQTVSDTVKDYTARIFQHETDHLEGILYTDRLR